MSVTATLWQHINFGGFSSTSDTANYRYYWNKYGSGQNDQFSSLRAWDNGNRGHIYAFENINFDGRFASLNVGGKYSSAWWSYVGDDFNDVISSTLLIARNGADQETEVALGANVKGKFTSIFDDKTMGKPVSRDGDPQIFATYFPSYDPTKAFASIKQALNVQVRIPLKTRIKIWNPFGDDYYITIDLGEVRWVDYMASIQYDIYFHVDNGVLHGESAWATVWVESGLVHQQVYDDLAPPLIDAAQDLTNAIEAALALFSNRRFSDAYLIPGNRPDLDLAGQKGSYDDDVVLVVVAA